MIQKRKTIGYISAILGGFSFGSIPILSATLRDYGISSLEQSILRLVFGAFIGFVILLIYWINNVENFRKSLVFSAQKSYILQGLIFSIMIVLYLSSIALRTPAGEAALLIQVHPIVTLIVGWFLLKEKVSKSKIASVLIAITGIIVLTEPWDWDSFLTSIIGDLLALLLGILYAFYILINRWGTRNTEEINPSVSISWVLTWSFLIGIPFLVILSFLPLPSILVSFSFERILKFEIVGLGFLLAFFGSLIPYGLIMIATRYIESSRASILLLTEPIGAILLAYIFLNETVTIWYL
ncbi:MAG: DMT family transporter, partial [Candidatus Thorarchaeota archaeon]